MAAGMEDPVQKEKEHVHEIYSQIATHFSDTRYKPWPRIAEFLNSLPAGSLVADIGCGNGKYLGVNNSLYISGSDICPELVTIAKRRGHEVMISDCLSLPYKSGVFDAVICIAVLHHLSTEERRRQGIEEVQRIMRPGGRGLVYVWAMEQERKKFESQDAMVPWHMHLKYLPEEERELGEQEKQEVEKKVKRKWRKKHVKRANLCENHDHAYQEDTPDGVSSPTIIHDDDTHGYVTDHSHLGNNIAENQPIKEPQLKGFKTYYRYYHVFCKGELEKLCMGVANVRLADSWYDHENWCIVLEKTS